MTETKNSARNGRNRHPLWMRTLALCVVWAIELQPAHLSCYDLVLEAVTPFGKQYQPGKKPLPDDETTAKMYVLAGEKLALAGYQHYEISNYAKLGYQCRHNRVYWENRPYYGFGMGAASYLHQLRFTRPRKSREYFAWVKEGCPIEVEKNSFIDDLLLLHCSEVEKNCHDDKWNNGVQDFNGNVVLSLLRKFRLTYFGAMKYRWPQNQNESEDSNYGGCDPSSLPERY